MKRRVDKIHLVASADAWSYVHTSLNPADVGTRENSVKKPDSFNLWVNGPSFPLQGSLEPRPSNPEVIVHKTGISRDLSLCKGDTSLDKLIELSADLYSLKKRVGYLIVFKQYIISKVKKTVFRKPTLDAEFLDNAFMNVISYVQMDYFKATDELLKRDSPDDFESILKRLNDKAVDAEQMRRFF